MRLLRYLVLASLLWLIACDDPDDKQLLRQAETCLSDHPEQALELLRQIDPSHLHTRLAKAQYGLYYSQALDKSGVDQTSDSLLLPAMDYYQSDGSTSERIRAYYYMGRMLENRGDVAAATLQLTRAEELLDPEAEEPQAALLYCALARMYEQQCFTEQAKEKYLQAADLFLQQEDYPNVLRVYWPLMTIYFIQKNYDSYRLLLQQAEQLTHELQDSTLYAELVLHTVTLQMDCQRDYARALQTLHQAIGHYHRGTPPQRDLQALGTCHLYSNRPDSARYYLQMIRPVSSRHALERATLLGQAYAAQGNYEQAYDWKSLALRLNDSIYFAEKQITIPELRSSYQKERLTLQNQHLERINSYQFGIAITLIVAIVLLVMWFFNRHQKLLLDKEHKIGEYRHMISQLRHAYEQLSHSEPTSKPNTEALAQYERQLSFLRQLLEMTAGYGRNQEPFYIKIQQLITTTHANSTICEEHDHELLLLFQDLVQTRYPGFIEALTARYPRLTSREVSLYCMIAMEISKTAICLVLNTSQKTYYNYRNTLRSKLQITNEEISFKDHFEQFIQALEHEKAMIG